MIERIFIPTVNRVNNQITYKGLPPQLKKKVTMVVQEWERPKYHYDCDYLVLPKNLDLNDYYCLAKTRKIIYQEGCNMKYAILDDDLKFHKRNQKYFGLESNMETSRRPLEPVELIIMEDILDKWLDEPNVTIAGIAQINNPPSNKFWTNNTSLCGAIWVNGKDFKDILNDLPLTEVRFGEDTLFFLSLLSRGYGNRVNQEYCFENMSLKNTSTLWDANYLTPNHVEADHQIIEGYFPDFFQILYDEDGERVKGGFRNYGKTKTSWSKAYKSSQQGKLV